MSDFVLELIRAGASPIAATADISGWYRDVAAPQLATTAEPLSAALRAGFVAPDLQHAFVAGYRFAIAAIAPDTVAPERLASFAATEHEGGHPRQIRTTLRPSESGDDRLDGEKTWATLVPMATDALVVARAGEQPNGRPQLVVCVVSLDASGVTVRPRPAFPVMPDVPHSIVTFENVQVPANAVLPGDGYDRYVRPFRTAEDLHVLTAATGLALRLALELNEAELIATAAALASLLTDVSGPRGLSDPMNHLLLAGATNHAQALWTHLLPALRKQGREEEAATLERDLGVFSVAARARKRRTDRALERLRRPVGNVGGAMGGDGSGRS